MEVALSKHLHAAQHINEKRDAPLFPGWKRCDFGSNIGPRSLKRSSGFVFGRVVPRSRAHLAKTASDGNLQRMCPVSHFCTVGKYKSCRVPVMLSTQSCTPRNGAREKECLLDGLADLLRNQALKTSNPTVHVHLEGNRQ